MADFGLEDLETDSIDLKLDEENELTFEVSIQGETSSKPIYRFVCECGDMSMAFRGTPIGGDRVQVIVPPLEKQITEGSHSAHLEVIVENRLFVPMQLTANFGVSTRVVAESVIVKSAMKSRPVTVSGATARVIKKTAAEKISEATAPVAPRKKAVKPGKTLADVYEAKTKKVAPKKIVKPNDTSSADLLEKLWTADKKLRKKS